MNQFVDFNPNWASLPGNTIADIMSERKISVEKFAHDMQTSSDVVFGLLQGEIKISQSIAHKLEHILGSTAEFWLQRELRYRAAIERIRENDEATWLKELPIKDMIKYGWIEDVKDKVAACLEFFNVPDIKSWRIKYEDVLNHYAFRTSQAYQSEDAAVVAWLRQGEILSEKVKCKEWNEELFEHTLHRARALTKKKHPKDFLPELINSCAECGVSVAIVRTPIGCRASGATKFINDKKAMLLLSFRYLSDDQFWFTFFHEAGHILLHKNTSVILEEEINQRQTDMEAEANAFAKEMLIPQQLYAEFSRLRGNKRNIIGFAMKAGVSPGIVVGQLQYQGYVEYKNLNYYKRRYDWDDISV